MPLAQLEQTGNGLIPGIPRTFREVDAGHKKCFLREPWDAGTDFTINSGKIAGTCQLPRRAVRGIMRTSI